MYPTHVCNNYCHTVQCWLHLLIHDSYTRTHGGSQCVLIWYTHLISAAGTELHHVSLPFLHNLVVSYPTVCTDENSRCG